MNSRALLILLFLPTFFVAPRAWAQATVPAARPESRALAGDAAAPAAEKTHPLAGVPAFPLKMTYDRILTRFPVVYLKINGGEPKPFLFDTGYSGTILLNEEEAAKMRLTGTADPDETNVDVTGASEPVRRAPVESVRALMPDGAFFELVTPSVTLSRIKLDDPDADVLPAVGIVGIGCFREMTVCLDFEKRLILLYRRNHPDVASLPNTVAARLSVVRGGALKIDAAGLFGKPEQMILDTGAYQTEISPQTIRSHRPTESFDGYATGAFGVPVRSKTHFFDSLMFQNWRQKNLLIGEAVNGRSLLGIDLLSRFRVTIDQRRRKVVFERTAAGVAMDEQGRGFSGIVLARRPEGVVVTGAIDRYKPLLGATVVAVEDKTADIREETIRSKPVALVQSVLDGYGGTETRVTVRRAGVAETVTVKRMTAVEYKRVLHQLR